MLRLTRWLCFPIARRLGWWPVAVYCALTTLLDMSRRRIWPPSPDVTGQMPAWDYPAFYGSVLVGLPAILWSRNRDWYRPQQREA
ncbi:hypothetical protein [Maricaulis maris]|uniref:hypothetical protein n=1 Tax=Maricaulis maris TaxID=74318 RepID=UPI003B8E634E